MRTIERNRVRIPIYVEMRKYLTIYEEAVGHIWLCARSLWISLNFLIYEENFILFFICAYSFNGLSDAVVGQDPLLTSAQTEHHIPVYYYTEHVALCRHHLMYEYSAQNWTVVFICVFALMNIQNNIIAWQTVKKQEQSRQACVYIKGQASVYIKNIYFFKQWICSVTCIQFQLVVLNIEVHIKQCSRFVAISFSYGAVVKHEHY
jgi:hypothetical protein